MILRNNFLRNLLSRRLYVKSFGRLNRYYLFIRKHIGNANEYILLYVEKSNNFLLDLEMHGLLAFTADLVWLI